MPAGRSPRPVSMTGSQAQFVLNYLISNRKVSPVDISEAREALDREIRDLTDRLASLGDIGDIPSSPRTPAARPAGPPAPAEAGEGGEGGEGEAKPGKRGGGRRRRRKANLSAEGRASLQLQGRYLGYLRKIPKRQRGHYKKIAATKGREAAVKAMMRAVK